MVFLVYSIWRKQLTRHTNSEVVSSFKLSSVTINTSMLRLKGRTIGYFRGVDWIQLFGLALHSG